MKTKTNNEPKTQQSCLSPVISRSNYTVEDSRLAMEFLIEKGLDRDKFFEATDIDGEVGYKIGEWLYPDPPDFVISAVNHFIEYQLASEDYDAMYEFEMNGL